MDRQVSWVLHGEIRRSMNKISYEGTPIFWGAGELGLAKGGSLNEREHILELKRTSKKFDSHGSYGLR